MDFPRWRLFLFSCHSREIVAYTSRVYIFLYVHVLVFYSQPNEHVLKVGCKRLAHAFVKLRYVEQGVVTIIRPVEPSATGIKMESSDQEAI